jgi:arabinan endo-1,5-alpha-L-arabinosidase
VGTYEKVTLGYRVVVGYGTEQTNPDFQVSTALKLDAAGTIDGSATDTWTYTSPYITLKYGSGSTYKVKVERERDWENRVTSTLVFTGLDDTGTAIWGKKK